MDSYQLQQIQHAAIIASQHKNSLTSLHHHHHFSNHHNQHTPQVRNLHQPSHTSSSSSTSSHSHSRPIVERGASWSYNETRILLFLWGTDTVQRQLNQTKRTKHVWNQIAEAIQRQGFDRTAGESSSFLSFRLSWATCTFFAFSSFLSSSFNSLSKFSSFTRLQ